MSIWPGSTPWRALVGSAWCRLCHDSPMLSTASGQKLADLSREANGGAGAVDQARRPVPGPCRHLARCRDAANRVVVLVGDEHVTVRKNHHPIRSIESRRTADPVHEAGAIVEPRQGSDRRGGVV